jgi:two-component system repressor protein LuxO
VGASNLEKVDVRIICATNRAPLKAAQEEHFREDLYYRLHVIPINHPPLRERGSDILEIARRFLTEFALEEKRIFNGFSPETESKLLAYSRPGNVRELQNAVRNVVVMEPGGTITPKMLPVSFDAITRATLSVSTAPVSGIEVTGGSRTEVVRPLWQVEKETVESAIDACEGNIPQAAALLELSSSTIYRKRQSWKHSS